MKNIFFFLSGFIFFSYLITSSFCQSNFFIVKENITASNKPVELPEGNVVLKWDNGWFNSLGLGQNGSVIIAARFADTLATLYSGYYLTHIEFAISNLPSSIILKVFDEGTNTSAGPLIYSQDVSSLIVASSWNTIDINTPILITGNDIWIGYEVTMTSTQFVIGMDDGPVHPDGDWLFDPSNPSLGWYHLSQFGFDNNWVIRGYLTEVVPVELTSFTGNSVEGNVTLNWSTATETNNQMFEIERASSSTTPVQDWRTIGFVEGKGTTIEHQEYSYIDRNVTTGKYFYRLKQIDFDGGFNYSDVVEVDAAPVSFSLEQNYPNPFNPSTTIRFDLPEKEFVSLKVYDVLGNEVAELLNEEKNAGNYQVDFTGFGLSSGIYFYKIETGEFIQTKKMILLK